MVAVIEDLADIRRMAGVLTVDLQPYLDPMIGPESPALVEGAPYLLERLILWNSLWKTVRSNLDTLRSDVSGSGSQSQ